MAKTQGPFSLNLAEQLKNPFSKSFAGILEGPLERLLSLAQLNENFQDVYRRPAGHGNSKQGP